MLFFFFFFQAEDGIRDVAVTGVQTCALPICAAGLLDDSSHQGVKISGWFHRWAGRRKLERQEITWLLVGLGACILLFLFILFAGDVMEGDTQALDVRILRALRKADDPSKPIGPDWMELALQDLTALGGPTVLGLVVFAVVGFLVLQARYHTALVILITAISGELLSSVMKRIFMRPRPTVVPHLRHVVSSSFPSGHAMESAII